MGQRSNGTMGRFRVDLELANNRDLILAEAGTIAPEEVRRVRVEALVDTGATGLVLPEKVTKALGLPVVGNVNVVYVDRRKAQRSQVGNVWLELLGRGSVFSATVEPTRRDALIGAIVLEELDLLVDCRDQKLYPRDPKRVVVEIE